MPPKTPLTRKRHTEHSMDDDGSGDGNEVPWQGRRATPLMVAIRRRRFAIGQWLIDHRGAADIDEQDTDGCTALHVTFEFGLAGIVLH